MKKCFLVFSLLCFMSQMGFANVIIDIDVKLSKVVPASYAVFCGPTGCTYQWTPNEAFWMAVHGPSGTYIPFTFVMKNNGGEGIIALQEGNSTNPIPGAGIALPDSDCDDYSYTTAGYVRLRLCEEGGEEGLVPIYFTRLGDVLTVRLGANPGGFFLSRLELGAPPPPTGDPSVPADRSASTTTASAGSISPNPFSQSLEVKTSAGETESVRLQLLNANGQSLHSQIYQGGQVAYNFPTEAVPPGFYFLRVQVADRIKVYPVVKID